MGALKEEDLPHYTYKDYKKWEGKWEIIEGVAYAMSPSPVFNHQMISFKIAKILDSALKNCNCVCIQALDWKIDYDTVVCPDNSVICDFKDESFITKPPLMIFEILSPSTAIKDKNLKFRLYEENKVIYYIIVNPNQKNAQIYHLQNNKYHLKADTTNDTYIFKSDECEIEFDFSKVWER